MCWTCHGRLSCPRVMYVHACVSACAWLCVSVSVRVDIPKCALLCTCVPVCILVCPCAPVCILVCARLCDTHANREVQFGGYRSTARIGPWSFRIGRDSVLAADSATPWRNSTIDAGRWHPAAAKPPPTLTHSPRGVWSRLPLPPPPRPSPAYIGGAWARTTVCRHCPTVTTLRFRRAILDKRCITRSVHIGVF
eukprot:m.654189 g.654189  ORF g.654189 m.654189 type:complete len:194 (+) comp22691_c2_seq66:3130-3711(+)